MEQVFLSLLNLFKSITLGITDLWSWLTTTWFTYGIGDSAVDVNPLMIFSITGLLIVAAVMLIKFLNPAS